MATGTTAGGIFHVVSGKTVNRIIEANQSNLVGLVRDAYIAHAKGNTINPNSFFLRFPDQPSNRIIALPASIQDDQPISGIKWIGSYPANIENGLPRASAVVVLNDFKTGYPIAMMEAAVISSNRTATSAVLAAQYCCPNGKRAEHVSFVGAGIIARTILSTMIRNDWSIDRVSIYDLNRDSSKAFAEYADNKTSGTATAVDTLEQALTADIVCFATNAGTPYVAEPVNFRAGQVVLNVSLRDIAPELILQADNILDDVEHCLKANTSPHLAEQMTGGRAFVTGTISDLAMGNLVLSHTRPTIVSPFGLGVLDIVLARYVLAVALEQGSTIEVPDFFGELQRWPTVTE